MSTKTITIHKLAPASCSNSKFRVYDKRFKTHFLSADDFATKAFSGKAKVFDVRNRIERKLALFPGIDAILEEKNVKALRDKLATAAASGKEILLYDHSGNDVHWFQYVLEDLGVERYHFLQGGAKAFF